MEERYRDALLYAQRDFILQCILYILSIKSLLVYIFILWLIHPPAPSHSYQIKRQTADADVRTAPRIRATRSIQAQISPASGKANHSSERSDPPAHPHTDTPTLWSRATVPAGCCSTPEALTTRRQIPRNQTNDIQCRICDRWTKT